MTVLGLAALLGLVIVLRLRREDVVRAAIMRRHDWEPEARASRDLPRRLLSASLFQIGHSRRIPEVFRADPRTLVFTYNFEIGFEYRRHTYHWVMVVRNLARPGDRATITRQDWLALTVMNPTLRLLHLGGDASTKGTKTAAQMMIVEDEEAWTQRLTEDLSRWFQEQPQERSWEIFSDCVVGCQPGRLEESLLVELARAAQELTIKLDGETGNQAGERSVA